MSKSKNTVKEPILDFSGQEQKIKDHLKTVFPDDVYSTWIEFFDFESTDGKKVVIGYYGDESIKTFKKLYGEMLQIHISSVLGCVKKVKIHKRKVKKVREVSGKMHKNIKVAKLLGISSVFAVIALIVGVFAVNYVVNLNFRETFYNTSSLKVNNKIRVIQISDLHSKTYGKENSKLADRVKKLDPDIILLTGDIIESNNGSIDDLKEFCKKISMVAPAYFVYGNNEVEKFYDFALNEKDLDAKFGFKNDTRDPDKLLELTDELETKLKGTGVTILKNEMATVNVGTTTVDIFGVLTSNPSSFWSYAGEAFNEYLTKNSDRLKITAIHEPFVFNEFSPETWGDLAVCGHTHGGTVRIPGLGPLYTHEGGILPSRNGDCVYGRYDMSGTPIIVSSGLDNNILRINNQPELVIIDINKF